MTRVRPSITRFDLALGGYAGALALVGIGVATGRGFLTRPPLAAAVAVLPIVAGVAATRGDLTARIVQARIHLVLAVVPLAAAVLLVHANTRGVVNESVATRPLLGLVILTMVGVLVHITATNRYVASLREHERVLAEWRAPADARYRWGVRGLSLVGSVVVLFGSFVAAVELHLTPPLAPIVLGPIAGVLLAQRSSRGEHADTPSSRAGSRCAGPERSANSSFPPGDCDRSREPTGR